MLGIVLVVFINGCTGGPNFNDPLNFELPEDSEDVPSIPPVLPDDTEPAEPQGQPQEQPQNEPNEPNPPSQGLDGLEEEFNFDIPDFDENIDFDLDLGEF